MDNSKIWLIADTHFCHNNIIKYCNRPFTSADEMDKKMITNWNSAVKNKDRIFMLGDFCLAGRDRIVEVGNKLNGRKTLIMGNHDSASLKTYYEAGFEIVSRHPIIIEDFIILSHEPMFTPRKYPYFNIYGHVHNDERFKDYTSTSFCVSAERLDYTPIRLDTIKDVVERYLHENMS
ncbi:metallophosphoesterase [Anaerovoracaceae bacterium 41-7]